MNLQPTIEESPIASHCKTLNSRGKPLGMLLTGALWILFQVYWWGLAARNSAFGTRRLDLCRLVTSLISTSSIGFLPRGKCQRLHPPREWRRDCDCSLLLRKFGFGLFQKRDVRIGIPPKCQEFLVRGKAFSLVACEEIGARQT
jgi:hypothetical protein